MICNACVFKGTPWERVSPSDAQSLAAFIAAGRVEMAVILGPILDWGIGHGLLWENVRSPRCDGPERRRSDGAAAFLSLPGNTIRCEMRYEQPERSLPPLSRLGSEHQRHIA